MPPRQVLLQLDFDRKGFAEAAAGAHRLVRRRAASDVERVEDFIASRKVAVTLRRMGARKCPQIWRGSTAQRPRVNIR